MIMVSAQQLYERAQRVVKVKQPLAQDLVSLRSDHVLFCYLHLAADAALLQALCDIGLCGIPFESVADEDGRLPFQAQEQSDESTYEACCTHLGATQPKNGIAHGPQPFWAQLQSNNEEQEHDAELGKFKELFGLVIRENPANGRGTEQDAGNEIAEHGSNAEPTRKRTRNCKSGQ